MFAKICHILPLGLGAVAVAIQSRATTNIGFYAYASSSSAGIGGLPVQYIDGMAYVVDTAVVTTGENVTFSLVSTTFAATTADGDKSLLYIPSTSGAVGFTSAASETKVTTKFGTYGTVVYNYHTGSIETLFYAEPTETTGLWQLTWDSDNTDAIAVAIKDNAPTS
ncbi:hypothetical protein PFICI_03174 [Pestalotiopsis fici W106-1]|uniref:Uncharacterized protein n=1 Tax=Pestalotiopsis fici (strain W106-1 / CGMCC3.15140) TaxID=1229662 RepID=W3XGL0_PESFW|nr:uncharacterized protein PFICI_03174 [Pestalotiopsis fici W106-1]ETS85149.1 hypothetical protein PFICI_03174 [Pestalotiopsis fici W106-1]